MRKRSRFELKNDFTQVPYFGAEWPSWYVLLAMPALSTFSTSPFDYSNCLFRHGNQISERTWRYSLTVAAVDLMESLHGGYLGRSSPASGLVQYANEHHVHLFTFDVSIWIAVRVTRMRLWYTAIAVHTYLRLFPLVSTPKAFRGRKGPIVLLVQYGTV